LAGQILHSVANGSHAQFRFCDARSIDALARATVFDPMRVTNFGVMYGETYNETYCFLTLQSGRQTGRSVTRKKFEGGETFQFILQEQEAQ